MNLRRLSSEIWKSSYYRFHAWRITRLLLARRRLAGRRICSPEELLDHLGIPSQSVLDGFSRWRSLLEEVVTCVNTASGEHGGVSLEDGMVLYGLVRALNPEYVIETGVAAGVSTAFLGAALIDNAKGKLFSIELPPGDVRNIRQADGALFDWPCKAVGWAIPNAIHLELAPRHTLILEDVHTALPRLLEQLPFVDLFIHDDLHTPNHMLWEYELVWPKIRPGGILASDDVNEGWVDFCKQRRCGETALRNMQRFAASRKPLIHS
jgi:predicted O-methyltransferase YrrM